MEYLIRLVLLFNCISNLQLNSRTYGKLLGCWRVHLNLFKTTGWSSPRSATFSNVWCILFCVCHGTKPNRFIHEFNECRIKCIYYSIYVLDHLFTVNKIGKDEW